MTGGGGEARPDLDRARQPESANEQIETDVQSVPLPEDIRDSENDTRRARGRAARNTST